MSNPKWLGNTAQFTGHWFRHPLGPAEGLSDLAKRSTKDGMLPGTKEAIIPHEFLDLPGTEDKADLMVMRKGVDPYAMHGHTENNQLRPGSNNWGMAAINPSGHPLSNGFMRELLHETGHLGHYPREMNVPMRKRLPVEAIPRIHDDGLLERYFMDSEQRHHTNLNHEYINVLTELKRDRWQRTGHFPRNEAEVQDFLDEIHDLAPSPEDINPNSTNQFNLYGPGERWNYGPMQGVTPDWVPTSRRQIEAVTPWGSKEALQNIRRALLKTTSTDGGRPDVA